MKTICIKIYGNVIDFILVKNFNGNINTCKITENNEFFFTTDYLENHFDTLDFYISPIINKNQVTELIIHDKNLLTSLIKFLNYYKQINTLLILKNQMLDISDTKNIEELNNIKIIKCYDMNVKDYKELSKHYHKHIELYSEILFESSFMNLNNISTYSDVYQKEEIIIESLQDEVDKNEFKYFINNNVYLKSIKINKFDKEIVNYIVNNIHNKNVIIAIITNGCISNNNLKYLKNLKKENKIKIKIEYTKHYKTENAFKQLNLNILRFSLVLLIVISISFISLERFIFARDKKNTNEVVTKLQENNKEEVLSDDTKENEVVEESAKAKEVITYKNPYYQTYSSNISELKKINSDTVGWINLKNTSVNYPVVMSSDNDYYLHHSFDKSSNTFGWIYADYRSHFDELNQNTILYGHNVLGTNLLFGSLSKTVESSWYENSSNLIFSFNTEKENMKWQIFSIYVIPVTNDYLITNFNSETSFLNFVQMLKDRSVKDFGVEVNGKDKIITLSTCYKDSTKRVVIHAKRIS